MEWMTNKKLTCENGFVHFELLAGALERHVGELSGVEEVGEVVAEAALGYLELVERRLAADVHAVGDHVDLAVERELVVDEQAVGLVQQEVATDELLESPVFALHELVRSLALFCIYICLLLLLLHTKLRRRTTSDAFK